MRYASCPFCLSSLQVTTEQLAIKDGLIRCGHCDDVFNAHSNPIPALDNKTPVEDLKEAPSTKQNDEPLPIAASWEKPKTKPNNSLPYGSFCFLLTLLLCGQFIYLQADYLTQNTRLQPTFKRFNSAFGWRIPHYKNLEDIQIIERQLGPHPKSKQILLLELTIKNNALAEQEYPTINVILTSSSGEKVAQGVFTKDDYLDSNESYDLFAPLASKQIGLSFKKPQGNASGFEISFSH